MGGRFINAFAAGLSTGVMILSYRFGNAPLFLINGVLVGFNLIVYFHKDN